MTGDPKDVAVPSLPEPDCTYADHSYPAYSRKAVERIVLAAIAAIIADRAAGRASAEPEPMFYGRWHHGNGNLCCGTMRYFRADFDTSPAPDVREGIFDWVCTTMNAALDRWREQKRARESDEDAAPTPTASIAPKAEGEAASWQPEPSWGRAFAQLTLAAQSVDACQPANALEVLGQLKKELQRLSDVAPVAQAAAGASDDVLAKLRWVDHVFGEARQQVAAIESLSYGRACDKLKEVIAALSPRPEADADRASGGGVECPDCRGSEWRGWKRGVPCHTCKGSGFTPTTKD